MTTLGDIGELSAVERLRRLLPARADVVQGAGDDCAVVRTESCPELDWLLTSDPVIEGVHFGKGDEPSAVGHKAVARVLSDLAAMGGEPLWALVDIAARPDMPVDAFEALYEGATALAAQYGLMIVGGDTSAGDTLQVHVFGVGSVPSGTALLRSTARPDDTVYVTGSLGGSTQGKHLSFEPRVHEGLWLRDWATSLIDVSDGLAIDLDRLTEMSGVGARLELAAVPVSQAALAAKDDRSPLEHACHDGEDFELLFTVSPAERQTFEASWKEAFDLPCTPIGVINDASGIIEGAMEDGQCCRLSRRGFEHFGSPAQDSREDPNADAG